MPLTSFTIKDLPTVCITAAILLGIYACAAYTYAAHRLLKKDNKGCECGVCTGDHLRSTKRFAYILASFLATFTFFHDLYHLYAIHLSGIDRHPSHHHHLSLAIRLVVLNYFATAIWLYCRSQRRVIIVYLLAQSRQVPPGWFPELRNAKDVNEIPFGTIYQSIRGFYIVKMANLAQWWALRNRVIDEYAPVDYWDFDHEYSWIHGELCDILTPNESYRVKYHL
ncbi:hypothetical protein IAU59_003401 [Kwoniella sp. CBS 9459]